MIRVHPLPALLMLVLLVLSACSPATPAGSTTPVASATHTGETPNEPTPTATARPSLGVDAAALRGVSFQVWHAFAGESYQVFSEQTELFNATNEWGIRAVPSGFGDHLTLYEAMQVAIQSGDLPNLVAALPEQALTWQAEGLVVDLAPYAGDVEFGLAEGESEDIPAALRVQDVHDGDWLGLPAQRSARFLYYNQTWAHELGFSAPPQNGEEFRVQACAANTAFKADSSLQNDGFGGWLVDSHWQTVYSWLLALGGSVVDEEAYTFRNDPNLEALSFLKSLYDDNCAWLSTGAAPFDAFAERKALFISADLSEIPLASLAMGSAGNSDEWTLLPFPGLDGAVSVAYGPSYTLLKSSPEEQLAAWLFMRWMFSADSQALWVESSGQLPLRSSVLTRIGPYMEAHPQWQAAVSEPEWLIGVPQLASWRSVRYTLEDGMKYIFQVNLPLAEIPSVLDEMQALAEELGSKPGGE